MEPFGYGARAEGVLDAVFAALADPTRRAILERLAQGEATVTELAAPLDISQPAVSKHLRVLKQAGLVVVRPQAQRRLYALRPEPLRELDAWLTPYRRMWSERLDALERHLDAMPDHE